MKRIFVYISTIFVCSIAFADARKRPNILLLLADDMGYGELGCYGQKVIKTPNLDALAAKGVRFENFYAGCSVCSPSRGVLMTGIHAGHATIRGNKGFFSVNGKWDRVALRKSEMTVAEMLKGAGYQTAFVGKWHLGIPQDVSTWAAGRGFDFAVQEQWGPKAEGGEFDERDHWFGLRDKFIKYDYRKYDCLDEFRTEIALEYIENQWNREKPLFLFMSYRSPHAHEFYLRETERYKEHGWPEIERRHASRISMLDEQVQRLLDKLSAMGEMENTFVLFTSDNGPHRENRHDQTFFNSSNSLKGYKRDMYEGGVRVPGFVYWKGRSKQGVSQHQAAFYDVMPTFAEVAGIETPEQSDGTSFLPEILGKKQKAHDHLYWEIQIPGKGNKFRQATRRGNWKAVRYGNKTRMQLYDLAKDPYEENNVVAKFPEIAKQMEKILKSESVKNPHFPYAGGK